MAKPIAFQPQATVPAESLQDQLDRAPQKHTEALLNAYALLQTLHETRTIDFLRGAFGAGDTVVSQVADVATSPQSTRAIRNLLILINLLGSIDPDTLEDVVKVVSPRLARVQGEPTPSLWETVRRLTSPNARRAIGLAAVALVGVGAALNQRRNKA